MLTRRVAAAALLGLLAVLPACSEEDPDAPFGLASGTPTAVGSSAAPTATPSASASGHELSITGVPVDLPPPPSGGFDAPVTVRVAGAPPLRAEVARRPDQRARGLMQRRSLPEGTGMVFLFPDRSTGGFYMLGTLVPLSIAYVDGDRVVSTAEMEPCPGQSCPTYPPAGPYTFAVEAAAGFFPMHGVKVGTRVTIEGATAPPS